MLLRYRHELLTDGARRALWARLEGALLALPDTHHGNWTSPVEGLYLTGAATFPGAGVWGTSGRNAAMTVLTGR